MTQEINATLMPEIGRTPVLEVTCATCHHGLPQPRSLHQTLIDVSHKDGIEAVVGRYRELRGKYYGRGVFDQAMGRLSPQLQGAVKQAVLVSAKQLNEKPADIIWGVDRMMRIHCKPFPTMEMLDGRSRT